MSRNETQHPDLTLQKQALRGIYRRALEIAAAAEAAQATETAQASMSNEQPELTPAIAAGGGTKNKGTAASTAVPRKERDGGTSHNSP